MVNKFSEWQVLMTKQRQCWVVFVLLILLLSGCGLQGASAPASTSDQDNTDQQNNTSTPKVSETIINGKA